MLFACRRQCEVLRELDPTFGEDRDFVQAAIDSDTWSPLRSMSFNAQRLHPDLVIEAISKDEILRNRFGGTRTLVEPQCLESLGRLRCFLPFHLPR